ncbi:Nuclear envelope morphology protein 1 [Entomophthora muscae]|uniref:Nuclear envelope morphology protein 1 n=1 Tax=Entomophthora muscae TaxID=34485 RepID=A0ACC2URJ1_9FUNG|nr:Nuclear envelope morphology protein 1 [Entomophthora muscae]
MTAQTQAQASQKAALAKPKSKTDLTTRHTERINAGWSKFFLSFFTLPNPVFKVAKGLKPRLEKKWLVLDLDETLIHSTSKGSKTHDHMVEVLIDKHACLYYVYRRPHVDYFLRKVSEWYHLAIFTASVPEYANAVIDLLDPDRSLFQKRLFRKLPNVHTQISNDLHIIYPHHVHGFVKDLTQVDNDLSRVLLVDNSPVAFEKNTSNAVPIASWYNNNAEDHALLDLLPFLDALRFVSDVRSILSFRIQ